MTGDDDRDKGSIPRTRISMTIGGTRHRGCCEAKGHVVTVTYLGRSTSEWMNVGMLGWYPGETVRKLFRRLVVNEPSRGASDPRAIARSRLADAVEALQSDAQSMDSSLPTFADPLTADDIERVKALIGAMQQAVDRVCEVIAPAAGPTRT